MRGLKKEDFTVIEQIIWLRLAQMVVNERYKDGDFKIPIHLAFGHESLAVAISKSMMHDDVLILTHRNIHYNLLRMGTLKEQMDEYYLRDSGIASGHLGSMNLSNPNKNVVYSSSVLGNNLAVASGFALGNKVLNKDDTVFVITGDGAIEEGALWESLVFNKSNDLNTIFVVENNKWSLGTTIEERRCNIDLEKLADSLDIDFLSLKGNDPFDYINLLRSCREKTTKNSRPIVIEAELVTLGHWYKKIPDGTKKKYINYHAGIAPTVKLKDYPLISKSNEDPLYVIRKYLKKEDIYKISKKILLQLETELK